MLSTPRAPKADAWSYTHVATRSEHYQAVWADVKRTVKLVSRDIFGL